MLTIPTNEAYWENSEEVTDAKSALLRSMRSRPLIVSREMELLHETLIAAATERNIVLRVGFNHEELLVEVQPSLEGILRMQRAERVSVPYPTAYLADMDTKYQIPLIKHAFSKKRGDIERDIQRRMLTNPHDEFYRRRERIVTLESHYRKVMERTVALEQNRK